MSITITIIVLTSLISITAFYKPEEMERLLFWPAIIKEKKQYYRFVSSGFVHADWMHLGFNMLTLYFFGRLVEQVFQYNLPHGNLHYILLYVICMVAADIPTYLRYKDNYSYRALGASGAVSGVLFASILYAPWSKIYIMFIPIGIPAWIFGILFLIFTVYMNKRGGDNINHNAHLWGALCGIIYTIIFLPEIVPYFIEKLMAGG